jgi:hypothetical protein
MSHAHGAGHGPLIATRNQIESLRRPNRDDLHDAASGFEAPWIASCFEIKAKRHSVGPGCSVRNAYLFPPSVFGLLSRSRTSPLNPDRLRSPTSCLRAT